MPEYSLRGWSPLFKWQEWSPRPRRSARGRASRAIFNSKNSLQMARSDKRKQVSNENQNLISNKKKSLNCPNQNGRFGPTSPKARLRVRVLPQNPSKIASDTKKITGLSRKTKIPECSYLPPGVFARKLFNQQGCQNILSLVIHTATENARIFFLRVISILQMARAVPVPRASYPLINLNEAARIFSQNSRVGWKESRGEMKTEISNTQKKVLNCRNQSSRFGPSSPKARSLKQDNYRQNWPTTEFSLGSWFYN